MPVSYTHLPKVGDFIEFTPGRGEEDGWLESVHPRKNSLELSLIHI